LKKKEERRRRLNFMKKNKKRFHEEEMSWRRRRRKGRKKMGGWGFWCLKIPVATCCHLRLVQVLKVHTMTQTVHSRSSAMKT
jgi:hypothetical protein